MKKYFKYIKYLLLFIFLLFMYYLLPVVSDDWGLYKNMSFYECVTHSLKLWHTYSGRFFGEVIANYVGTRLVLKLLFESITTLILIIILLKFFNKKSKMNFIIIAILILGMDHTLFGEVLGWFACYSHYMIPAICLLIYCMFIKKIIFNEEIKDNLLTSIICLFLGIFINFFIENASLLGIFIAIVSIILTIVLNKKIYKFQIVFLIMSILCSYIMLKAPVYWGDAYQYRYDSVPWFNNVSLFGKLDYNLIVDYKWIINFIIPKIPFIMILSIIVLFNLKNNKNNKKIKIISILIIMVNSLMLCLDIFKIRVDDIAFYMNVLMLFATLIWYILIITYSYIISKDNYRYFIWLLFLLISSIFAYACLLFIFGGAYPRCTFFSYLLLIIYLIALLDNMQYERLFNYIMISSFAIIFIFMMNILLCNFVVNNRRERILRDARDANAYYVMIPRFKFYRFLHCEGEIASVFHKYAFTYYYEIDFDTVIYSLYPYDDSEPYYYAGPTGDAYYLKEFGILPKKNVSK